MNSIFEVVQDYRTEKEVENFEKYFKTQSKKLIRNEFKKVTQIEIGDIIHITVGDKLPGNALIIDQDEFTVSKHLYMDESVITGESACIPKNISNITLLEARKFSGILKSSKKDSEIYHHENIEKNKENTIETKSTGSFKNSTIKKTTLFSLKKSL